MAKFVLDQQEDQSKDNSQKKQSKYDQSLSGKNVENVSTEHTHHQMRYEEDHIESLKAAQDTTEISTESDLTQTHKAGSTTTIEQRSPIVDKTYQGQSISEKTSQHDIKMKADIMSETFVGKTHEIHSYTSYQSQTPQNETYETTENITFNTTSYIVAGDKTYAKGKKVGGVATTGILKQDSLIVKTDKYKAITSSAINFMSAVSPPNAMRKLNQQLTDNQYEYDEIKWDHKGVYQVADIIFEPKSQNFYTLDDVKGQAQLSVAAPLICERERLSKSKNVRQTSLAMQNIQDALTSSNAFTDGSQLIELIHFGTMHVSYIDQSAWAKFQDYQAAASSVPMDDEKQTIDFETMTQTIAGKHQDEDVENVLAEPSNSAYERFRKFIGLHSQQSILDSTNYLTTPEAVTMRYAMGITDQLGFNNEPMLFPLTHQHDIQADYAQGKATIEGYFPNTHGNLMQQQGKDIANGVFVAELKFELEGFPGAALLLSDSFTYQAQEEKTDNENVTYPYLETQSKADSLISVPFGNKITGTLGWVLERPSEFGELNELKFLNVAEVGGSAQLPQDIPQTFKIIYQDNQFYIAMNDAWLYESLKKGDQPKRNGNLMPFVVLRKTFIHFIQFAYYQLLDKDYDESGLMAQTAFENMNDIVAYGVWGYVLITDLYKDHDGTIEEIKNKVSSQELTRNDLAYAINSDTFTEVYPYSTAYVKGRWLYTLLNFDNNDDKASADREAIAKAVNRIMSWVQKDIDHTQVMQNYVPFSNTGKISFTEGSKQFNQDKKGL
jgi:hypothetical protein